MTDRLTKPIVDQEEWGHPAPYDDGRWVPYAPEQYVLHWGGGRSAYNVTTLEEASALARGWRRFHVNSRGWRDIAYNYMAWHPVLRLRGENQNGAHHNSSYWGPRTRAVVFPVTHNETPTWESRRGFARLWVEHPLPVTGHGLLSGQSTSCPGPWLKHYIEYEGWVTDFGTWSFGDRDLEVRSIRIRLNNLNYRTLGTRGKYFSRGLRRVVRKFQDEHDVVVDGVVGPQTLDAMATAEPRETPWRWWDVARLWRSRVQ